MTIRSKFLSITAALGVATTLTIAVPTTVAAGPVNPFKLITNPCIGSDMTGESCLKWSGGWPSGQVWGQATSANKIPYQMKLQQCQWSGVKECTNMSDLAGTLVTNKRNTPRMKAGKYGNYRVCTRLTKTVGWGCGGRHYLGD